MKRSPRIPFRDLHGIVLLDKPPGLSSNQALQTVRRLLRASKGGHTGALDPLATGLLPLCFGEATKLAGSLLGARKAYLAECRLGVTTDTADSEGEVVQQRPVPELDDARVEAALARLRGRILQVPPMYSALKQGGERLYAKARRGETVELAPREVEVHRLELLAREGDTLQLRVECGSGTYVRSLAVDLGEDLGCGAHLTALRRIWVEPFREPRMVTLTQLEQAVEQGDEALLAWLLPVSAGLSDLPVLRLDETQSMAISRGQQIVLPGLPEVGHCAAYASDGALLALLEADAEGRARIVRGFNLPPG
ncbi:tRNA pseudouridine(55) synthase [Rhodanobacter thiooxydans]|uniref:tRNA pseudouridine synthase B n=1 Tax=Rhodanobacter thiooxydans TaxID=416169 RepID=A0A154QHT1_9GAMM|nr:tRNA pseudouridine(55) synthase TruB [Rhodanobacter thiooxydans]EIL99935.1 tRNA pseudouridine synthase B [Rhodanobacter thiooxydans LCS2]KZC23558.1 tRNA pseudouridine(55) synthase [Rhodanobacter thiooxydans]MCW0200582.1 tRNA pseudouridine(55) synthase TruB [Rhodanobacter thiooxydans]